MPAVYPVLSTTQAYGGCESFHTATELHYPESFLYFNYLFTWWRTHLGSKRVIFCHKILKKKILVENCVYWFKKRRKREREKESIRKCATNALKRIEKKINRQTVIDRKKKGTKWRRIKSEKRLKRNVATTSCGQECDAATVGQKRPTCVELHDLTLKTSVTFST